MYLKVLNELISPISPQATNQYAFAAHELPRRQNYPKIKISCSVPIEEVTPEDVFRALESAGMRCCWSHKRFDHFYTECTSIQQGAQRQHRPQQPQASAAPSKGSPALLVTEPSQTMDAHKALLDLLKFRI